MRQDTALLNHGDLNMKGISPLAANMLIADNYQQYQAAYSDFIKHSRLGGNAFFAVDEKQWQLNKSGFDVLSETNPEATKAVLEGLEARANIGAKQWNELLRGNKSLNDLSSGGSKLDQLMKAKEQGTNLQKFQKNNDSSALTDYEGLISNTGKSLEAQGKLSEKGQVAELAAFIGKIIEADKESGKYFTERDQGRSTGDDRWDRW